MGVLGALGKAALGVAALIGIGKIGADIRADIREEEERRATPCDFDGDDISADEFESIARKLAKRIRRIEEVDVYGPVACFTVRSQSGISTWDFSVDFNNWGHVTGWWKLYTDNTESSIPGVVARDMSSLVEETIERNRRKRYEREESDERSKFSYEYEQASRVVYCTQCGQAMRLPVTDKVIIATCPRCGFKRRV